MVRVAVTHAAPHHLIADLPPIATRRTRAGDAWEARQARGGPGGAAPDGPSAAQPQRGAVLLGMPGIGRPAPK